MLGGSPPATLFPQINEHMCSFSPPHFLIFHGVAGGSSSAWPPLLLELSPCLSPLITTATMFQAPSGIGNMNMNMDFNKLKERAAAAATEATNIVSQFNELDAMAAEDEYLKTDDLNVKGQNKKEKWVEDLDDEGHGNGSTSVPVSAPNTATKLAHAAMMTPAAGPNSTPVPVPSATPAASHTLAHQQSSTGYELANDVADGSETPALDSIFGQAEQAAPPASGGPAAPPPFASPEERAQQLIAQALFQTPMSSAAPSRATSMVGETSFLDYDSAREDEDDEDDKGAATTNEKAGRESNASAGAETSENDTERENAVMDYLSRNSAGDSFSILDKVMSSSQSQAAEAKQKPSTTLADLDSALGNDLSSSADATKQPTKREVNNSYMLSAVADLMSGKTASAQPPQVTYNHQASENKWKEESSAATANISDHQNPKTSDQPNKSQASAALDYDSDDSSSVESDWGGKGQQDPILSLMQKEGKLGGRTGSGTMITNVQPLQAEESVTVIQGGVGGSLYDGQHGVQRKDPNRFISDIDRRAAPLDVEIGGGLGTTGAVLNDIPQELLDGTPSKVDGHGLSHARQQPFGDAGNKFQWFKQAAMGKVIQSVSKLEMALSPTARNSVASRKDPRANAVGDRGGGTTEDEYSKVVSSSLLADEEHRELMRLKQNALENQNILTKIIDLVQSNPRFAFIAFTMVLLYFVSHWTRKRTEDDVTR